MADIEFADLRDGGDGFDIVVGQPVTGMDFQTQRLAIGRRLADFLQQVRAFRYGRIGISAGMQFHHRRAQRLAGLQLALLARAAVERAQRVDRGRAHHGRLRL